MLMKASDDMVGRISGDRDIVDADLAAILVPCVNLYSVRIGCGTLT